MNIVLFIIFIAIFSKNKKDRKRSDLFRWILRLYIGLTVLSAFIPSPVLWVAAIALIAFTAVNKLKDSDREKKRSSTTEESYRQSYEQMKRNWEQRQNSRNGFTTGGGAGNAGQSYYSQTGSSYSYQSSQNYTASRILPKPLTRRTRIINAFNEKYDLSLTDEEVRRIAEASYVSEGWKREVEAMTAKYETEGQWFSGPTDWLRVYIYAFEIQNISSDFTLQEQICFETLDEVMAYACSVPDSTVEECILRVNERYFTRFNEMSFMIAYRILQRKGRNYELPKPDLVKNVDQDLEEMMKKYRTGTRG